MIIFLVTLLSSVSFWSFVGSIKVKQFPSCLHFDIEPHAYSQWSTDRNGLLTLFFDLLDDIKTKTHDMGLCLDVDFPNGYDQVDFTRGGTTLTVYEWLLKVADRVTLMDYIDDKDLFVSYAEGEVQLAAQYNKKVMLGVETQCCDQCGECCPPTDVTFCLHSDNELEETFDAAFSAYSTHSGFGGVVIHYLEPYYLRNPVTTNIHHPRSMWAWNVLYEDAENRKTYFQFLKDRQVNELFIGFNDNDAGYRTIMTTVLNETKDYGISVQLLFGDNGQWIYNQNLVDQELADTLLFMNSLEKGWDDNHHNDQPQDVFGEKVGGIASGGSAFGITFLVLFCVICLGVIVCGFCFCVFVCLIVFLGSVGSSVFGGVWYYKKKMNVGKGGGKNNQLHVRLNDDES